MGQYMSDFWRKELILSLMLSDQDLFGGVLHRDLPLYRTHEQQIMPPIQAGVESMLATNLC